MGADCCRFRNCSLHAGFGPFSCHDDRSPRYIFYILPFSNLQFSPVSCLSGDMLISALLRSKRGRFASWSSGTSINPYINHNQLVSRGGASLHVLPFQASGSADADLAFVPPLQSVLCVVPDRNHGRNADHVEVASFLEANGSLVDSSAQYVELRVQLLRLYDYSAADLCAL